MPPHIHQQHVIAYLEQYYDRFGTVPTSASGQSVLDQLPEFLFRRIDETCLTRTMLRSVPIFMSLRASTLNLIQQRLIPAVCGPAQKVYSKGDLGEEMYAP
jgi:hypothetical protein